MALGNRALPVSCNQIEFERVRSLLASGCSEASMRVKFGEDVCLNLIGLFDTVAAISNPLRGDFIRVNITTRKLNQPLSDWPPLVHEQDAFLNPQGAV